ncbi:hypothetical protein RYX36_037341, partial [Vicia faba]
MRGTIESKKSQNATPHLAAGASLSSATTFPAAGASLSSATTFPSTGASLSSATISAAPVKPLDSQKNQ